SYRYAIDNVMDPMHGTYLHAQSHSMTQGDRKAEFRARQTDIGLVFEKTNQTGVNFDWVEWGESGASWMRLSIPYQKKFGPGGSCGLGRAFAEAAIAAGANVTIADVSIVQGKKTAKEIGAQFLSLDLASAPSITRLAKKLKKLDGVVHNAAITNSGGRKME